MMNNLCLSVLAIALSMLSCLDSHRVIAQQSATPLEMLKGSQTTVFLGDSITAAGQYSAYIDAWITTQRWAKTPKLLNLGLPSETVSGLTEEGHAGGKFPRPDVAERIDRVFQLVQPDLVFACYGINCGIYQPFDQTRFEQYQAGYRRLKQKVETIGAKLVVITPPFYDDKVKPLDRFSYNDVLAKYAAWLVYQRQAGWSVIDLHTAMTQEILKRRQSEPNFSVQPDGVHPNDQGHWLIARNILQGLGAEVQADDPTAMLQRAGVNPDVLSLLKQRGTVLRDSYVGTAGHLRPGMARGLPIDAAEAEATRISQQIFTLLMPPK